MGKRALITGIARQDGFHLAEFLLSIGYEVHGVVRRVALEETGHRLLRFNAVRSQVEPYAAPLDCCASIYQAVAKVAPDECYHPAAQSFVSYSFDDEFSTPSTNINGTHFFASGTWHLSDGSISRARARCSAKSRRYHKPSKPASTSVPATGSVKSAALSCPGTNRGAYNLHATAGDPVQP